MKSIINAILFLLGSYGESNALVASAQCDKEDGTIVAESRTPEAKKETRTRILNTCRAVGFSWRMCDFMDAIVCRESACGVATVRHTLGPGEEGLGPMGLSIRWQKDKWPGSPDPEFCIPEVSAVVAAQVIRNAYFNYSARTIVQIQSIYGGRFGKINGRWRPVPHETLDQKICKRMEKRGIDCHRTIQASELGIEVPYEQRRAFVSSLLKLRLLHVP